MATATSTYRFGPLLAVAVGGTIGSLTRWGVLEVTGDRWTDVTVVGLNVVGSLLVGALLARRSQVGRQRLALLEAGFAGGLTTFSTFAVAVAEDLERGALLAAVGNCLGTIVTTVVGAGLGYRLSLLLFVNRRRFRRRRSGSVRRPVGGGR